MVSLYVAGQNPAAISARVRGISPFVGTTGSTPSQPDRVKGRRPNGGTNGTPDGWNDQALSQAASSLLRHTQCRTGTNRLSLVCYHICTTASAPNFNEVVELVINALLPLITLVVAGVLGFAVFALLLYVRLNGLFGGIWVRLDQILTPVRTML